MTNEEKISVGKLRDKGYSYSKVALELGLSVNTIKAYCKRHGLGGVADALTKMKSDEKPCQCCGKPVSQSMGRKEKRFCSTYCRNKWWNAHLDQVNRKANYEFECAYCKSPFISYGNKNRKYCSHKCYIADRFGGES